MSTIDTPTPAAVPFASSNAPSGTPGLAALAGASAALSGARPVPSDLLAPTAPVEIQEIKQELRASLHAPGTPPSPGALGEAERARSHLSDVDASLLHARVDWPIALRTLGSDRAFKMRVTELTHRSLFVACSNFSTTAFRAGATIVQAELSVPRVLVEGNGTPVDHVRLPFLAKVVKVVPVPGGERDCEGFALSIVQMDLDKSLALSDVLARLRDGTAGSEPAVGDGAATSERVGERVGERPGAVAAPRWN